MLINNILNSVENLEARFDMRCEMLSLGLQPLLQELKSIKDEELQIQIDTFEEGAPRSRKRESYYTLLTWRTQVVRTTTS
jgi:hypothetical protein